MSQSIDRDKIITKKLDLDGYLDRVLALFARPKRLIMQGDINIHYRHIQALSQTPFPPPSEIPNLDTQIARLQKQAILSLDEIYAFVTMISYFNKLKTVALKEPVSSWIHGIEVPDEISTIIGYFNDQGEINPQKEPELLDIQRALTQNKRAIKDALYGLSHSSKIKDYLVDTQIHFQNSEECLLVRGGFNQVIKATVIGRSASGFFYIIPNQISQLKAQEQSLLSRKEDIVWRYCKEFSEVLHKWVRFLQFVDKEYDRFDHYQARVLFAKQNEYQFILPSKGKGIELSEFAHPAIEKPVTIDMKLDRPIMLITGVNAGGKTMLLKSILSAVYMSKYLLPFRCNPTHTSIGSFKNIEAIIDDPQSVKNDISTFAGRMVEFSRLFEKKDAIIGVDEIELGTDADEAAALFKILLESLCDRGNWFIVTTHHKRLASLMATDDRVEMVAALYDEELRLPTYTFLQGSIGKSYAFETAQRYGISPAIVEKAREFFGEDKERLNELIEQSTTLEREMRLKLATLDSELKELDRKKRNIDTIEERLREEHRKELLTLENRYNAATKRAQKALKTKDSSDGRRLLNEAHKQKLQAKSKTTPKAPQNLSIGDRIKYRSHQGELLSIKNKEATIVVDGLKMRVPLADLKLSVKPIKLPKPKPPKATSSVEKSGASISIKLLGMYGDEAIDRLDKFISDAMLNGLNEVEVIHGTGGGVLARLVTEYLKEHPKIDKFYRVSGNLGATIVEI